MKHILITHGWKLNWRGILTILLLLLISSPSTQDSWHLKLLLNFCYFLFPWTLSGDSAIVGQKLSFKSSLTNSAQISSELVQVKRILPSTLVMEGWLVIILVHWLSSRRILHLPRKGREFIMKLMKRQIKVRNDGYVLRGVAFQIK